MFGLDHKDDNKNDGPATVQPMTAQPVNNGLLGIDDDASDQVANPTLSTPTSQSDPVTGGAPPLGAPSLPAQDDSAAIPSLPDAGEDSANTESAGTPAPAAAPKNDDELLDIKREALQELSPLIDHLDQTSEEKFRTTMMMIQASDNQALIPQAFTTAKQITDDKKRAQALLDVVNEINYFTQKEQA